MAVLLIRLGFPPFDLAPAVVVGWMIFLDYINSPQRSVKNILFTSWLCGFLWNLSMTFYTAYPHWATSFGWVALSAYLGFYWLLWAWVCRCGLKLKLPLWFIAPTAWTGLELVQGHFISGFLLNQQAIALYKTPVFVQCAEFTGCYGVSFIVLFLSALAYEFWRSRRVAYLTVFLLSFAIIFAGGHLKENQIEKLANTIAAQDEVPDFALLTGEKPDLINIALIQGNVECKVEADFDLIEKTFEQYNRLTSEALDGIPRPDLVVWPEGMFRYPQYEIGTPKPVPTEDYKDKPEQYIIEVKKRINALNAQLPTWVKMYDVDLITGIDRCILSGDDVLRYNSAVNVSRDGAIQSTYDKNHLVLFGEYIPFADKIPLLKQITPIGSGTQAGSGAPLFSVTPCRQVNSGVQQTSKWFFLPSICYENTLPHVIREQFLHTSAPVDALVNISNDSWFKGGFENELRMAQAVFRSVEFRIDNVIASNGGISAHISPGGRIITSGRTENSFNLFSSHIEQRFLQVQLRKNVLGKGNTFYAQYGDCFSGLCLLISVILGCYPLLRSAKSLQAAGKDGKNR